MFRPSVWWYNRSRKCERSVVVLTEMLNKPFTVGGYTLQNRVVLQPMEGCDCETDGSPSELTREKYRRARWRKDASARLLSRK